MTTSDRTQLDIVEISILDSIAVIGGTLDGNFVGSADVVDVVSSRVGLGRTQTYKVLCDLASSWLLHLRLVDYQGDIGAPGVDATPAGYTKVRLSTVGQEALESHLERHPAIPVGLINGNIHMAGLRPPLDPLCVIEALRTLIAFPSVSDEALSSVVGLPAFPGGCRVEIEGQTDDLVSLRLQAIITTDPARQAITISHFPPPDGAIGVPEAIATRFESSPGTASGAHVQNRAFLPVTDINIDFGDDQACIKLTTRRDADLDDLTRELMTVVGIIRTTSIDSIAPATMVRDWVARHADEDLSEGLMRLTEAIQLLG